MKIYTKTGDAGETGLFGGARVSKADPRVDSYGAVDEANACLGVVRAAGVPADIDQMLDRIQRDLPRFHCWQKHLTRAGTSFPP